MLCRCLHFEPGHDRNTPQDVLTETSVPLIYRSQAIFHRACALDTRSLAQRLVRDPAHTQRDQRSTSLEAPIPQAYTSDRPLATTYAVKTDGQTESDVLHALSDPEA